VKRNGNGRRGRGDVEAWCDRFESACRERGVRVTPQRLAVYRALADDLTHPTADALHGRLRTALPSLSLATVYRILESLAREGFVHRVGTDDGAARFDANVGTHQHLVCRACDSITDVHSAELAGVALPPRITGGFRAENLDIRVVGLCAGCGTSSTHRSANR
jgi:Fur family peroxide stress response transcriptional regulator